MDYVGVRKNCFWNDRAKMRPKSLPLRTPFWMKNERHAAWERDSSLKVFIFLTKSQYFDAWHPLLAHHPFSIHLQNMQKCIGFIDISDGLTGPCWATQGNVKNRKTSATLHGNASGKCKTSGTLHGNAFFVHMVQIGLSKRVPKKSPKPFILTCF